ncbi:competence protein f [hydrocarbon metagenome]|uniref:Competence protein f n=1 Tax=hydrocarbon metagenome TaxID=938273 RepID=A0A0W8G1P1_9ZZZZ
MKVNEVGNILLDFFLPRLCLCCNSKLLSTQRVICDSCFSQIDIAPDELIQYEFDRKFSTEKIIDGFVSPFVFKEGGNLQILLHELKYKKRFRVGNILGVFIGELSADKIASWNIDYIIPIPLHKLKKADRGYNQSDHIGISLAKYLNKPYRTNIVKRKKFTESQTKLNILERKTNIEGAFKLKRTKTIRGKNILLLDDVITTGATVTELGKVLKENEANKVYACSVALAG